MHASVFKASLSSFVTSLAEFATWYVKKPFPLPKVMRGFYEDYYWKVVCRTSAGSVQSCCSSAELRLQWDLTFRSSTVAACRPCCYAVMLLGECIALD